MTHDIPSTESAPIACMLAPLAFRDRLSWIQALNARALREHRRADLSLHLTYNVNASDDVRELVRREQACCAFLLFDLREEPAAIRLTVTVPEAAREAADLLLAYFMPTGDQRCAATKAAVTQCSCGTEMHR